MLDSIAQGKERGMPSHVIDDAVRNSEPFAAGEIVELDPEAAPQTEETTPAKTAPPATDQKKGGKATSADTKRGRKKQ
jgi:hypothetical protein